MGEWCPGQGSNLRSRFRKVKSAGVAVTTIEELAGLMGESTVWLRRNLNGLVAASLTDLAGRTYHLDKPDAWPVPNSIEDLMMPGDPRFRPTGRRRSAYR